ncbi:MAG TPA: septum formation family protein [Candidatus Limnocylindrales bacterium]|nr:septum formation family protein [Candidatus Limnocylindrales bacterium]
MARLGAVTALLAALVGAMVLAGCTSVTDVKVGDCFDGGAEGQQVIAVTPVDCAKPHEKEAFSVFDYQGAGDAYPGQVALDAAAEERCRRDFQAYVGIDYDSSKLGILYFTPSEESWKAGDHEITCAITAEDAAQKLTGSKRGTRE